MNRDFEYQSATAGRENADVAKTILGRTTGDFAELSTAHTQATLAIYEVLADIAAELSMIRRQGEPS